jgi:hypothetical protein
MEAYLGYKMHSMVNDQTMKLGADPAADGSSTATSGSTTPPAPPASTGISASTVFILIVMLVFAVYAGYLSFTSNKLIDVSLENAAKGAGAGTFINAMKALSAGSNSIWYIMYYHIFKKSRVNALKALTAVKTL